MKRLLQVGMIGLLAALTLASAGCKRGPKNITALPGSEAKGGSGSGFDLAPGNPIAPTGNSGTGLSSGNSGRPYNPNTGIQPVDLQNDANRNAFATGSDGTPLPVDPFSGVEDRETLRGNTVYFDFDKAAVRKSEQVKVAAVAEYMKSNPGYKLQVEGHCDERGTEGYNLALGERRALSVRETLLNMGVSPANVTTVSFGEARPADPAQNDAAYAKNRRAEFVVILPQGGNVR
jgi:peptidoglycan-associated lipoprotein